MSFVPFITKEKKSRIPRCSQGSFHFYTTTEFYVILFERLKVFISYVVQ